MARKPQRRKPRSDPNAPQVWAAREPDPAMSDPHNDGTALPCDGCGRLTTNEPGWDPYQAEVHDRTVVVRLCTQCRRERHGDI